MSVPVVRLATVADSAAVAGLRRAWVEEQAGGPVDDDSFADRFAAWWEQEQGQRVTWLAAVDDVDVGMLNLTLFTRMPRPGRAASRWGYVANVYVLPTHRSGGVGGRLLAACTAYADREGLVRLVLAPSERSVPFYARAGFAPATSLMLRPGPGDGLSPWSEDPPTTRASGTTPR